MESKKVICPKCHGVLEVTNPKQEAFLQITCPNPNCGAKLRLRFDTGETIIARKKGAATTPGYLSWQGKHYDLQKGRNTIGRKSSKHEAQLELDTDDKSVSRLHCLLEAITTSKGRVKVIISDLRTPDKVSQKPILLDDEPLAKEDRLVLEDNDTFQIGGQTIRFIQKDADE